MNAETLPLRSGSVQYQPSCWSRAVSLLPTIASLAAGYTDGAMARTGNGMYYELQCFFHTFNIYGFPLDPALHTFAPRPAQVTRVPSQQRAWFSTRHRLNKSFILASIHHHHHAGRHAMFSYPDPSGVPSIPTAGRFGWRVWPRRPFLSVIGGFRVGS